MSKENDNGSHTLCVVILNWNNGRDTVECLDSLVKSIMNFSLRIVVCDNKSCDDSVEQIRHWGESCQYKTNEFFLDKSRRIFFMPDRNSISFASVEPLENCLYLIHNGANLGFSGGNNTGIRFASKHLEFDFLLILNNDAVVTENALNAMVLRLLEDDRIGICGAKIVYAHTPDRVQAWGGASFSPLFGRAKHIGSYAHIDLIPDRRWVEHRLDYVLGVAMMVSKSFINEVGLLSEDYFLYFEEADWAVRALRKGYKLGYSPDAVIYHKEGATIGSSHDNNKRSLLSEYHLLRSRLIFTRKFYPWFLPTVIGYSTLLIGRVLVKRDWKRGRIMFRALFGLEFSR